MLSKTENFEGFFRSEVNRNDLRKLKVVKADRTDIEAPAQTGKIRLNKFIANSGVCSRREADELITMGVISVNGKTITELGYKVNPGDEVATKADSCAPKSQYIFY